MARAPLARYRAGSTAMAVLIVGAWVEHVT